MNLKMFCKYNDQGAWCTNKEIKRFKILGIIPCARTCMEYSPEPKTCVYKETEYNVKPQILKR